MRIADRTGDHGADTMKREQGNIMTEMAMKLFLIHISLFAVSFIGAWIAMAFGLGGGWGLSNPNRIYLLFTSIIIYAIMAILFVVMRKLGTSFRMIISLGIGLLASLLFYFYVCAIAII